MISEISAIIISYTLLIANLLHIFGLSSSAQSLLLNTVVIDNPVHNIVLVNLGKLAYWQGDYKNSMKYYELGYEKIKNTSDNQLQATVTYDLGNTYYRLGEKTLTTNPQATCEYWGKSVNAYTLSVKLHKTSQLENNLTFVKNKLDELDKRVTCKNVTRNPNQPTGEGEDKEQKEEEERIRKKMSEDKNQGDLPPRDYTKPHW